MIYSVWFFRRIQVFILPRHGTHVLKVPWWVTLVRVVLERHRRLSNRLLSSPTFEIPQHADGGACLRYVELDIPHKHQDLSQTALSWCKFSLSSRTACFKSSWLSLYNWFPPPVAGVAPAGYFCSAGASGAVSSATFWSSVLVSSPLPPPAVRDQRAADSKA